MRNFKKVVAGLLAVLMLALSVNVSFAAEEYSEKEAIVVAKVNGSGIMTGTDKGFEPSKSLTRAEAAAIIVRMKGISESAVKAMAGTTLFTDVAASHWASGYVNEASNLGIVKGVSATQFAPEREVTIAEFVTMAIRALGAGQLVDSEGTWPTNYVNFANENDILKDVTAIYTATATRMNAATIVVNTLKAPMWEKVGVKSNGEIEWGKVGYAYVNDKPVYQTILGKVLNISEYKHGIVSDLNAVKSTLSWDQTTEYGDKSFDEVDASKNVDIASLKVAFTYDVWYDNDTKEIVAIWKSTEDDSDLVSFDSVKKVETKDVKVMIDGKEVKEKFDTAPNFYLNGSSTDSYSTFASASSEVLENTSGSLRLADGKVTDIYGYRYTSLGKVEKVTDKKVTFEALTNVATEFDDFEEEFKFEDVDDEDLILNISKDGKGIKLEDLEEDDVVIAYELDDEDDETDTYFIKVLTNTVEGKVTAKGTDYIKLDGKRYDLRTGVSLAVKDEAVLFLNDNDKIIAADGIESDSTYALIKELKVVNTEDGIELRAKLLYSNGEVSDFITVDTGVKSASPQKPEYAISNGVKEALDTAATAQAANATIKEDGTLGTDTPVVGTAYKYEIKSEKLQLVALTTELASMTKFSKGNAKSYFASSSATCYITDSTDILVLTKYKDDDDKSSISFKKVTLDEISTTPTLAATAVNYKADKNKADFIVVDEITDPDVKIKRDNQSEDWSFILSIAEISDGDYTQEITLVDANGDDATVYGDDLSIAPGDLGIASISDDELTDKLDDTDYAKVVDKKLEKTAANETAFYVYKVEDGVIYFVNDATTNVTASYVLAEKVLYIENDGTNLAVAGSKDLEKATYEDGALTVGDGNVVEKVIFEQVETGIYEVVAIVFAK